MTEGPTVFAIAWIPRLNHYEQLPAGFRNHRLAKSWRRMFRTGNVPPPAVFGGVSDFHSYIKLKDYRGVVGFRDVKIRPPQQRENSYVGTAREIQQAGFTPLKVRLERAWASLSFGFHSRGEQVGMRTETTGPGIDFISAGLGLEFRVGRKLNWIHKLTTGHWLPYVSAHVQYSLEYGGDYDIEVSSTNVPNLTVYRNWQAVAEYSMEHITVAQVEDFVTAYTRRTPATFDDRFRISGTVYGGYTVTRLDGL